MGFFDYQTKYNNGEISLYLYDRASDLDRDGVAGLSKLEYEQFQRFFSKDDIENYGLDIITLTDEERKMCEDRLKQKLQSDIIPDNIRNSENVTEQEKKNLKGIWNATATGVGTALAGGCTVAVAEVATSGAASLAAGLGAATAGIGFIVALVGLGGYYVYRNHLENKAEEQQQKSEGQ